MRINSNNFDFHTQRLFIRKMNATDVPYLYAMESKPEVVQYITGKVLTYEETAKKLQKWLTTFDYDNGFGALAIFLKDEKEFVGLCGIIHENEVAYRFLPKFWRKGYGKEILDWLILYAEVLELNTLKALVIKENEGSLKLLKRKGFVVVDEQICEHTNLPEFIMELNLEK